MKLSGKILTLRGSQKSKDWQNIHWDTCTEWADEVRKLEEDRAFARKMNRIMGIEALLKENEQLEAENAALKRQLASWMSE